MKVEVRMMIKRKGALKDETIVKHTVMLSDQ